jgi:hypothetical protein
MGCWQNGQTKPITDQEGRSRASQEKAHHERCWPRKDRSRTEGTLGEAQGRKEGCLKGNAVGKLRNQSSG